MRACLHVPDALHNAQHVYMLHHANSLQQYLRMSDCQANCTACSVFLVQPQQSPEEKLNCSGVQNWALWRGNGLSTTSSADVGETPSFSSA